MQVLIPDQYKPDKPVVEKIAVVLIFPKKINCYLNGGFYLCPSCSQKRALLFGEYISNEVLLTLPHRHFVFTFPKMLRVYFRNNRKLVSKRLGNHSPNILPNKKLFDAEDFIAELTQHIPPLRMRLVRYYGLYSSRSRWKWPTLFRTSCAASAFEHPVQQPE